MANSCSTMHKIAAKEFTLEDFSCEHLIDYDLYSCDEVDGPVLACAPNVYCGGLQQLKLTINVLNFYRQKYLEYKSKPMKNEKARKDFMKKYWWQIIQLLPSSYNQKRTVMLNYEVLAGIYPSRKDHKLDEWHEFCDWIEGLPYSEIIVGDRSDGAGKPEEKKDIPDEIMEKAKRRVYEELKEKGMKIFEDFWSGADPENKTGWLETPPTPKEDWPSTPEEVAKAWDEVAEAMAKYYYAPIINDILDDAGKSSEKKDEG